MPLIVDPVSVTNVDSSAGIVVAALTGIVPGQAVATLTSDELTGGTLEVAYDATPVGNEIANRNAFLATLPAIIAEYINAGTPLNSDQNTGAHSKRRRTSYRSGRSSNLSSGHHSR